MDGIVLEEVGKCLGRGQVIDGHDVEKALPVVLKDGSERETTDSSKSINGNLGLIHGNSSLFVSL